MAHELFDAIPEDLAALTDAELADALAAHNQAIEKIRQYDVEFLGELSATEVIAQLTQGRENALKLKAEKAAREEAQDNFAAEVERLTADLALNADPTDDTEKAEEPKAETTDPEPENVDDVEPPAAEAENAAATVETHVEVEKTETVTASVPARLSRPPAPSARHTPRPNGTGTALVAAGALQDIPAGQPLDRNSLQQATISALHRYPARPGAPDVVIATAKYDYPEERILDPRDSDERIQAKIDSVVGRDALVASGGLCAPVSVRYELENIAVTDRPVRDALASYQAVRGGLRFAAPPVISDVTTGVGRITAAQDAAGGSSGTKTCQTVICPSFSEVDVAAIFHCLSAGNLGARAYPEQLAQFTELVMAAHARAAETALLDGISAGSTQVTAAQVAGATSSLFPAMINAAAQIRSHYRMASDAVLRVLMPAWAKDLLKADVVRQPFDKFQISDAEMVAIIRSFNIAPSFYIDGETGGGQVLNTQSTGALNGWPTTVKWFIFPEGTWLFLDGGTLELGLVRDSVLNATNTFQMFGETWENVAKVGPVSYEVTSTVQDTGALSAPATITSPAY